MRRLGEVRTDFQYVNGRFFTPADFACELHRRAPDLHDHVALDPCCGDGALIKPWSRKFGTDLHPADGSRGYDFLAELSTTMQLIAANKKSFWALNPPYTRLPGSKYTEMTLNFVARCLELTPDKSILLVSKATFLTGHVYKRFTAEVMSRYRVSGLFVTHSGDWDGLTEGWPIVFTRWDPLPKPAQQVERRFEFDVVERNKDGILVKTGTKVFKPADRPMNKWVKRPKATEPALPMVSWYPQTGKVYADKLATGAIGYLESNCNDVQHCGSAVNLTTGPRRMGWSITPDNFHESLVVMACRKLVKPTWQNDRDEFNIPLLDHPAYPQFALDCVVFALFHGANYSSSLDPVEYKGRMFELRNQFMWVTPDEFAGFAGLPMKVAAEARKAETPFVATWLRGKQFSPDARDVLAAATKMLRESARFRLSADPKYQLHRWDAGWYQVRFGLYGKDVKFQPTPAMAAAHAEFQTAYKALGDRLRPIMYELDVLPA